MKKLFFALPFLIACCAACHREPVSPEDSAAKIEARLVSSDPSERSDAIDHIATLGAQAVAALEPLLSNEDSDIRRDALWGLSKIGMAALDPVARTLREDRDPEVRYHATLALGGMYAKPQHVIPVLEDALKDTDKWVRMAAVEILAVLRDPKAIPALKERLADPEAKVRSAAAAAIQKLEGI